MVKIKESQFCMRVYIIFIKIFIKEFKSEIFSFKGINTKK